LELNSQNSASNNPDDQPVILGLTATRLNVFRNWIVGVKSNDGNIMASPFSPSQPA
jgi:hypothetical protein